MPCARGKEGEVCELKEREAERCWRKEAVQAMRGGGHLMQVNEAHARYKVATTPASIV